MNVKVKQKANTAQHSQKLTMRRNEEYTETLCMCDKQIKTKEAQNTMQSIWYSQQSHLFTMNRSAEKFSQSWFKNEREIKRRSFANTKQKKWKKKKKPTKYIDKRKWWCISKSISITYITLLRSLFHSSNLNKKKQIWMRSKMILLKAWRNPWWHQKESPKQSYGNDLNFSTYVDNVFFFFCVLLGNWLYLYDFELWERRWSVNFIRNFALWDIKTVILRCRRESELYSSICFMEKFLGIRYLCEVKRVSPR